MNKQEQKDFKEKNLSDNNDKEDNEMVYKRVKGYYKRTYRRGRPCKRVYVRAHLRRIKRR